LIARLPALLAISVFGLVAVLLLGLPVVAAGLAAWRWLLSGGDIYFYLSTRPPRFLWATAAVGVAVAAAVVAGLYILLRASFAVPACLLRSVGPAPALRLSIRATRGRTRPLMSRFLSLGLCLAVLWAIALMALSGLLHWISGRPLSDASMHRTGIAFAALVALVFAVVAAISRATFVLALLADHAADEALPTRPDPISMPGRFPKLQIVAAAAVATTMLAVAVAGAATAAGAPLTDHRIAITAHRAGSARAPENTMAALENAIVEGADVVEIDVQETADGEIVLLHDTDLRRVAGVPRFVWQMRLAELQQLDVGSWFAPRFRGERIPTLGAFAAASRGRVRLNVELKENGHGEDLATRVVVILRETGVARDASVSSLDLALLRRVRRIAPEIKIGLIVATGLGDLRGLDIDFVALARRLATPGLISQLSASQREVHVWTLDDEASVTRAILDGAHNIITGDPLVALSVRERLSKLSEPEKVLLRARYSLDAGWLRAIGRGGRMSSKEEATADDGDAGE
jgi:glycerophosphoryl diester phosphodiesterase